MHFLAIVPGLTVCCLAAAQTTHVVDIKGRNGAFKSVQAAVDAARDGDRILIRPGNYFFERLIRIRAKSLWLLGTDHLSTHLPNVQWTALPPGRVARISRLTLGLPLFSSGPMSFAGNGDFVVDRVAFSTPLTASVRGNIVFQSCYFPQPPFTPVAWQRSTLSITDTTRVVMSGCTVHGQGGGQTVENPSPPPPAIAVSNTRLEISHSTILGGVANFRIGSPAFSPGGVGMLLKGTQARLTGVVRDRVAGGPSPNLGRAAGLVATLRSTVSYSDVSLHRPTHDAGSTVRKISAPSLHVRTPFLIRSPTTIDVHGAANRLAVVFVVQALLPQPVLDSFHLDLRTLLLPVAAVLDSRGRATLSIPGATDLATLGVPLYLQGVEIDTAFAMRFTGVGAGVIGLW